MTGYALSQPYGVGVFPQQKVDGVQPAAGAGFTLKLDGTYVQRLISIVFKLTTDATVGNRYVAVEYTGDNGNAFSVNAPAVTVTPSTTAQRFAGGLGRAEGEWNTGTDVLFPLAPIFLHGGESVKITLTNEGGADQLSAIELIFDRFTTDPELLGAI